MFWSNLTSLSSFVANHPYYISEIRRTKKIASKQAEILNMSPEDQHKLKDDISSKIKVSDVVNTSIVILDTGINHAHPLIAPFLKEDDNRSYIMDLFKNHFNNFVIRGTVTCTGDAGDASASHL